MNGLFVLLIFALAFLNYKINQSTNVEPIPIRVLNRKNKR